MKKTCNAIATSTGEGCRKKVVPGSRYCFLHIEKIPLIIGAIVAAILSIIFTELYHSVVPSQELRELRKEVKARQKGEKEAKDLANQLKYQLIALDESSKKQQKEINKQFEEVKAQLEPFKKIAKSKYPNLSTEEAFAKIKHELKEVRELATRDIPKAPIAEIIKLSVTSLSKWHKRYPEVQVLVSIENAGNKNAMKVTSSVLQILTNAGIKNGLHNVSSLTIYGSYFPIKIIISKGQIIVAKEFVQGLANYVQGETKYVEDSNISPKTINVTFNGIPKFKENGKVILQ